METVNGSARFCVCRKAAIRAARLSKIPPKFAGFKLSTLEPKNPSQVKPIAAIKANPEGSYVFAGNFGCGKSLMLWMLYRNAIKQTSRKVVACTLSHLLDEFRSFIRDGAVLPSLSAAELKQTHTPYSIFLDDIDKARPTEYAAEQFFEIINAVYEFQHQLVVTTNLKLSSLVDHFDRADERFGGAIVRRLIDGADVYEMF